jgi:hypothetical protein
MSSQKRESITVLEECIELQKRKSQDYQNPNSNIVQAMHYRRGISTIHDMISQKLLRAQSLLEPQENGQAVEVNFESLEDTYKDLINYASFAVSWLRGSMEGQDLSRDMFNRKLSITQTLARAQKPFKPRYLTEDVYDRIDEDLADQRAQAQSIVNESNNA